MKKKRESNFQLSDNDNGYFQDEKGKIELVSCPRGGINCSEHRAVINKSILASHKFLLNKDYIRSIEALKEAYYKTDDLQYDTCVNCAKLFRCMVTESLENIHEDLRKMTSGLFSRKRYQSSLELSRVVLEEFKMKK